VGNSRRICSRIDVENARFYFAYYIFLRRIARAAIRIGNYIWLLRVIQTLVARLSRTAPWWKTCPFHVAFIRPGALYYISGYYENVLGFIALSIFVTTTFSRPTIDYTLNTCFNILAETFLTCLIRPSSVSRNRVTRIFFGPPKCLVAWGIMDTHARASNRRYPICSEETCTS